ncbi:carbohydrate ABC transporter permease [Cohnella hashimotonis]|uniref:Carbohydrate ABC transporter permease n=1 Tax=Cohnella hashimotonis TaxID=2826895 RepID=A0ABT6TEE3_9BACL|nr:carbohydrate ABC transporter permease [Cohnella hashimotonis]MDI4645134.1 carbohydrate ABC transporter permease [Cohnella hashimotonis]
MRHRRTTSDTVFLVFVYAFLGALSLASLLPLMQAITISLSPPEVVNSYGFHLIPTRFDFAGFERVIHYDTIWTAYGNTIVRTLLGTAITLVMTFLGAYPLSKRTLPNRKLWTGIVVLTMFFSGGMIPAYLLIKNIGIMNSIWALVLPGAVSAFMLLIVRNFIMALPESLEESAKIDGANDIVILFRIVLPLSLPIIATVGLYAGVGHWNAWFDSMIYIQDERKQVLQMILRKILLEGQDVSAESGSGVHAQAVNSETVKMAALVVSVLPILFVYPFLQKYFVKGTLMGSVKG